MVLGGAFSGAASALLVKRWLPEARVLVVEQAERFERRVGEATVEISSQFLHQVLGQYDHLSREHLPKHGLRYWFTDGPDRSLGEMSESGPGEAPRLPSFQLDRAKLDEHLLAEARAAGVEVLRPARVSAVDLGFPVSRITVGPPKGVTADEASGSTVVSEERTLTTRWLLDASGRHAFLARRLRIHRRTESHPTAALWGRWTGVKDLDGVEVNGPDPRRPLLPHGSSSRRLATNHFCGYGWWIWVIPLSGGETSIGVVYHKELVDLPGDTPLERYRRFVSSRPGLRELLENAVLDEDDHHSYSHLPYRADQWAGPGWALVGDAAAFLDPYYSPGLDHAAMSIYATAQLIEDDLSGQLAEDGALAERLAVHNGEFTRSYERWLDGLYQGKYEILGDAELTTAAFLLDTGLYYTGVVVPSHRDVNLMRHPVFGIDLPQATIAYKVLRAYNRRLQTLARKRRRLGIYGRRNAGWRYRTPSPGQGLQVVPMLWAGVKIFLRAEWETFWAGLRRRPQAEPIPQATAAPAANPSPQQS